MYCKNCGSEIADGADVCLSCGTMLKKVPSPNNVVKQHSTSTNSSISTNDSIYKIANLLCVISLTLIAILLFLGDSHLDYYFYKSAKTIITIITVLEQILCIAAFIFVVISQSKSPKQSLLNLGIFQLGIGSFLLVYRIIITIIVAIHS